MPATERWLAVGAAPDPVSLGRAIREARERQGIEVEEFADAMGVSREKIEELERGRVVVTDYPLVEGADGLGTQLQCGSTPPGPRDPQAKR